MSKYRIKEMEIHNGDKSYQIQFRFLFIWCDMGNIRNHFKGLFYDLDRAKLELENLYGLEIINTKYHYLYK